MCRLSLLLFAVPAIAIDAGAQDYPSDTDSANGTMPIVITPARLSQSLSDVPASVTIISAETLSRYGIRSVAEALRFVPGMAVTHASGPDYRINYHGTNILTPRRMNVLVDGISVYRPAFSEVIWTQLPLVVDDIERIEVTRAPSSASYGPNSLLAVVNIKTKHPEEVERLYGAVTFGSPSSFEAVARTSVSFGSTSLSVTASRSTDQGFDQQSRTSDSHDGLRLDRLNVRSHTRVNDAAVLELQGAVISGISEVAFVDSSQRTFPDRHVDDAYFSATWSQEFSPAHSLKATVSDARQRARQSWSDCVPTVALLPEVFNLWRANQRYAQDVLAGIKPSGGTAEDDALARAVFAAIAQLGPRAFALSCGTPNQDFLQRRTELELQDTFAISDSLRVVAGLGGRQQMADSATYLGGAQSSHVRWLFANIEGRPNRWLTLNGGGYFEHDSLTPATFSLRVAANIHVSPSQTVRFAVSKGTRSPDIHEQRSAWIYTVADVQPPFEGSTTARFYQSRIGPSNLVSERIRSSEVGYLWNAQALGLLLDVRVFRDRLSSLISEQLSLAGPSLTNGSSVDLAGAEVQASVQWSSRWSGLLNYAYLDNRNATNPFERTQYARHSGSIGIAAELGSGWRTSLAYAGASAQGLFQSSYGREDVTVSRQWMCREWLCAATVAFRRLDNLASTYANGLASTLFGRFDNRLQGYLQFSVRLP